MKRSLLIRLLRANGNPVAKSTSDEELNRLAGSIPWLTVFKPRSKGPSGNAANPNDPDGDGDDDGGDDDGQAEGEGMEHEMMIYGQIGADFYGEGGLQANEFSDAMNAVPKGKPVRVRINSPGGNVWDALQIHNAIKERGNVTTHVVGIAASSASLIHQAGAKRVMDKATMMMIHEPSALAMGDADVMRQMADQLDEHAKMMAKLYSGATGQSQKSIRDMMKEETWMDSDAAKEKGFSDETTDTKASVQNMTQFQAVLSHYRRLPGVIQNAMKAAPPIAGPATTNPTIMNRNEILALLKERGIPVAENATDAQLVDMLRAHISTPLVAIAQTAPDVVAAPAVVATAQAAPASPTLDVALARLAVLEQERETERRRRIEGEVDALIASDRVPRLQRDDWVKLAMGNETVLANLRAMPPVNKPGGEPIPDQIQITGEAATDVGAAIERFREPIRAMLSGRSEDRNALARDIGRSSRVIASTVNANIQKLKGYVMNAWPQTDTIGAGLQRQVIMSEAMRAFKRRVLNLEVFCKSFRSVPLEGTDKVDVPYYPLFTTASKNYVLATNNGGNGYDFTGITTNSTTKEVTITSEKYQPMSWTSYLLRRQPYIDVQMLATMASEQLALDVVNDVLSVITPANFGVATIIVPAAGFDSSSVADLETACNIADWPDVGRNLVLGSAYYGNLLKDPQIKAFLNIGSTDPIRQAKVGPLYGFEEVIQNPRLPNNGVNLTGFAVFPSAVVVATAPIMPAPGELRVLVNYDLVTDPETGVTFSYRYWGEPWNKADREIIDVDYGYVVGEVAAAKLITSA